MAMTTTSSRLLTAADLAALPSELPSGTVLYELWEGRLRIRALPNEEHAGVECAFAAALRVQGQRLGHGRARCGEVPIIIRRDPDSVVGADAAFLTNDQFPVRRSREGYLETVPALVVEVRSKNDTNTEVADKVAAYLAAGARVGWVADPRPRTVAVHRAGQPVVIIGVGDTLTADDIIPGFAVPVAELFAEID